MRDVCDLLNINRQSKYVESAIENRKQYDLFVSLEEDISVGETVSCRASPEAIVTAIESNGRITVKLMPYGTEK